MSEWIEHAGGGCPVGYGVLVDVKFRDGREFSGKPAMEYIEDGFGTEYRGTTDVFWHRDNVVNDIVAYRLSECRSAHCECSPGECSGGRVDKRAEAAVELKAVPNVNPKEAIGSTKIPMHLASPLATAYMALGLANGAMKYGTANFKATPVLASIYLDGAKRHINAWLEGEEYDPDDGVPNLAGGLANLAIIIEARANGTLIDDRPIGDGWIKERDHLTEIYRNLKKLHEGKNPHHFTRNNA